MHFLTPRLALSFQSRHLWTSLLGQAPRSSGITRLPKTSTWRSQGRLRPRISHHRHHESLKPGLLHIVNGIVSYRSPSKKNATSTTPAHNYSSPDQTVSQKISLPTSPTIHSCSRPMTDLAQNPHSQALDDLLPHGLLHGVPEMPLGVLFTDMTDLEFFRGQGGLLGQGFIVLLSQVQHFLQRPTSKARESEQAQRMSPREKKNKGTPTLTLSSLPS